MNELMTDSASMLVKSSGEVSTLNYASEISPEGYKFIDKFAVEVENEDK